MAIWLNSLIVPVSNEAIGVGVCAGAWLSRKRPDQRGVRDVGWMHLQSSLETYTR
jgi:hypothetical protein